jgi:hypothetical protein
MMLIFVAIVLALLVGWAIGDYLFTPPSDRR